MSGTWRRLWPTGNGGGNGNDHGYGADEGIVLRPVTDSEPVAVFVFKTMSDPFTGRISFFKVISGVVKTDSCVENYTRKGAGEAVAPERDAGAQGG